MKPVIEAKQDTETIAAGTSMVCEALPVTAYDTAAVNVEDVQQKKDNSVLSAAGVFKDDPEFAALVERVYERRKQMDKIL